LFPSSSGRAWKSGAAAAAFCLLVATPAAAAEPRLSVSGATEVSDGVLDVRVELGNQGDAQATTLNVEGELFGVLDSARIEDGVAPGATRSVLLRYPFELPRPGLHPLTLLLEYRDPTTGSTISQRAFLLLALGANPAPAVRLEVPETQVDVFATLAVGLESADGAAHRVRLSVLGPRGFRADPPPAPVDVPASGRVAAPVRVYRGNMPRDTRQGILVIAGATDDGVERTTVATGVVKVLPSQAWLPRLRPALFALAVLLLAGSVLVEVWVLRRPRS
jgi:hypothetical protein